MDDEDPLRSSTGQLTLPQLPLPQIDEIAHQLFRLRGPGDARHSMPLEVAHGALPAMFPNPFRTDLFGSPLAHGVTRPDEPIGTRDTPEGPIRPLPLVTCARLQVIARRLGPDLTGVVRPKR